MNFKNKVVVITGGSSGIGWASAKLFSQLGAKTYVLDIQPLPSRDEPFIHYLECDVSQFSQVEKAIQTVVDENKKIDCVFSNAGIHRYGSVEDTTLEDFEKVLNINFKGTFFLLKCVLPIMKRHQEGTIVLMGSDQSLIGKSHSAIYGATKGAVAQLAKSTAIDCGPYNVRVNCVCPGAIETPLYEKAVEVYAEKYAKTDQQKLEGEIIQKYPLQRIGKPEEVANLVAYLCSEESSFITGSVISIDGGYTAV